jgi:hypothetical protein
MSEFSLSAGAAQELKMPSDFDLDICPAKTPRFRSPGSSLDLIRSHSDARGRGSRALRVQVSVGAQPTYLRPLKRFFGIS